MDSYFYRISALDKWIVTRPRWEDFLELGSDIDDEPPSLCLGAPVLFIGSNLLVVPSERSKELRSRFVVELRERV